MERYCDSGCTDPTQATARLVIVLVRSIQKCGTEEIWGEQFGQMERDISFRPTKMTTGQSGPCTFKFRSDQTELVHSNGCTTLRPRTLFRHCFADGLNQKFISVCGSSCRVVRCQVLRIQWNFKSLERKKVFVISKSVVLKGWSQEETDKASS